MDKQNIVRVNLKAQKEQYAIMQKREEAEYRKDCLRNALMHCGNNSPVETVLSTANKFYNYIQTGRQK